MTVFDLELTPSEIHDVTWNPRIYILSKEFEIRGGYSSQDCMHGNKNFF